MLINDAYNDFSVHITYNSCQSENYPARLATIV